MTAKLLNLQRTQPVAATRVRATAPPANAHGAAPDAELLNVRDTTRAILTEVSKVIVGKKKIMRYVMVNILAEGNILFEDYPGLAKTVMASTFARASGCTFKRVQFTPDVLPADITGAMVFDQNKGEFEFRKGPVFTNILLADEINRAPPKTQSSLLEAMAERQVSVEGETHKLDRPYIVMATQNPVEQEGTYPLPEAQMDRFLMKLSVGYPNHAEEVEIGERRIRRGKDDFDVSQVSSPEAVRRMAAACETVHISREVISYIAALVVKSREHPSVLVGSSPRGTIALIKASRAWAAMQGHAFVTPDDVRSIAQPVLAHRLILKPDARFGETTNASVVDDLLRDTRAVTT